MSGGYIDPYGFSKGSGGGGSSGSGGGSKGYIDPYGFSNPSKGAKPQAQHHGGIGGFFGSVGHFIGSKASLAGHDIAQMPSGLYQLGKAFAHDANKAGYELGHFTHTGTAPVENRANKSGFELPHIGKEIAKQTAESIRHPGRDPFQTGLNVLPFIGAAGKIGDAGLAASDAARAGEGGMAAARVAGRALTHSTIRPRELNVPRLLKDENGNLQRVDQPAHLVESHAPHIRALQELHDRALQRSLDKNLTAEKPSLLARYAQSRVGRALDEQARIGANTRSVAPKMLSGVKGFDKGVPRKLGQLAIFMRSSNALPHEFRDFWKEQAANGEDTGQLAAAADKIHRMGLLRVGEDGNVEINADRYPKLARADELAKENQGVREQVIRENKLMSPEGLKSRKALVAETIKSEAARNPETGVREGNAYTNLSLSEKRAPLSPFARGRSPHIPKTKPLSFAHEATGEGVRTGRIPDNTTQGIARSTADALRFLGSKEHRGLLHSYGSDVKRFEGDMLVANPDAIKTGKLPLKVRQLLGIERSTLDTLPAEEEAGVSAAIKARLEDAIPRLGSPKAAAFEDSAGIGTEAPEGYRWVPKKMARELVQETTPRTRITKGVNDINSAITAATVYFKVSHIPQRLATDAMTSALSGAFKPAALRAAMMMRKDLSEQEFNEAAAATGTHGYQALPAEGESKIAHGAQKGAGLYAHRVDAPFRFLNLVNEARKAGIKDADGFRSLIKAAKDPTKATPEQLSVLKRSNRVSMLYDGLGPTEKRVITRGLWFYPWTKASVRFAGHTIAEHPLKAAIGGNLGALGRKEQEKAFGSQIPYYEFGLSPVGRNSANDLSRLSAFSTAGDVLQVPEHAEQVRSSLNPAAAGLVDLLTGTNSYGVPESRGKAALGDITAPTPEAQILSGLLTHHRHSDQSHKMFPKSDAWYGTHDPLLRSLLGPSFPRRINKDALAKAAEKWRTISIPVR